MDVSASVCPEGGVLGLRAFAECTATYRVMLYKTIIFSSTTAAGWPCLLGLEGLALRPNSVPPTSFWLFITTK